MSVQQTQRKTSTVVHLFPSSIDLSSSLIGVVPFLHSTEVEVEVSFFFFHNLKLVYTPQQRTFDLPF